MFAAPCLLLVVPRRALLESFAKESDTVHFRDCYSASCCSPFRLAKVDALVENGMVAPSFPPLFSSEEDCLSPSTDSHPGASPSSLKISLKLPSELPEPQYGGISDAQNGTVALETMGVNVIERPQCNDESGAGTAENACNNGTVEESKVSENGAELNGEDARCELKRRVQWNDSHGKDLVHVVEFEASDTGDSEEDDDDTESQNCTCTIQ